MIRAEDKFIDEIVKHGDYAIVEAYFKEVHKLMPEKNQKEFMERYLIDIIAPYSKPPTSLGKAIVSQIGMIDVVAYEYISRYIQSEFKDKFDLLSEAIENIGDYAPLALFNALSQGDPGLAAMITNHYGHIDLGAKGVITKDIDNHTYIMGKKTRVFGEYIVSANNDELLSSIRELKSLGVPNLFGNSRDSVFGYHRTMSNARDFSEVHLNTYDIPVFDRGVLNNPELAILASQINSENLVPGLFNRIPCWISPADKGIFDTAITFQPEQFFCDIQSSNSNAEQIEFDDTEKLDGIYSLEARLGMAQSEDDYKAAFSDSIMVKAVLSKRAGMGFEQVDEKILCMIDLNELLGFNIGGMNPLREDRVADFLNSFDMLSAIKAIDADREPARIGTKKFTSEGKIHLLDECSVNPLLMSKVIKGIGEKKLLSWASNQIVKLETYINLYKNFGYNNKDFDVYIFDEEGVDKMIESGYRFDESTAMTRNNFDRNVVVEKTMNESILAKLSSMGLWTGSQKELPENIYTALKSAVRKGDRKHIGPYLISKGLDAVAAECRTQSQWGALLEIFDGHDLSSVASIMPSNIKRKSIESSLDI